MAPPTRPPSDGNSNGPIRPIGVDNNIVINEARLRVLLASAGLDDATRDEIIDHLRVNQQMETYDQTDSSIERHANQNVDLRVIQHEGRVLRTIAEDYLESQIRKSVQDVANNTDLTRLDYAKFCEILQDLRRKDWLPINEGAMVVMLAYFKDLICRALSEGEIKTAASILWYFVKYVKSADLVQSIFNLISFGMRCRYVSTGVFLIAACGVATGVYKIMR